MALPKTRSTSVRKIHVRVPKRGSVLHYKRRVKGKVHSCAISGERLTGVCSTARNNSTPNRKFGGTLSSSVSSRVIQLASRVKSGAMNISEVDIRLMPYVKSLLSSKK